MSIARTIGHMLGYDVFRHERQARIETHLAALFPRLGVNVVVDAGANAGQYGRLLRQNGYTAGSSPMSLWRAFSGSWKRRRAAMMPGPHGGLRSARKGLRDDPHEPGHKLVLAARIFWTSANAASPSRIARRSKNRSRWSGSMPICPV
ncbi:MAG: hypothetical protein R3D43_14365 [Tepidamorphaceae bacterium]